MARGPRPGDEPTIGPDHLLASASAMVFVADPAAPILTHGDAHHLFDVLRLRPGEPVAAADGSGSWCPCRIAAAAGGRRWQQLDLSALLIPDGPVAHQRLAGPAVTVAFAPTKGDRPDWAVQKLTELGVDRIVPLRTARSVVRWEGERGQRAVSKLARVAREAAAQCRRTRLPEVSEVTTLEVLAAEVGADLALARPGGGPPTLARRVVAVGPEGGWAADEEDRVDATVGLGPTVLRAETAAVVAGALLCALRSGLVGPLA